MEHPGSLMMSLMLGAVILTCAIGLRRYLMPFLDPIRVDIDAGAFAEKIVWITGASSGIGRECALRFARGGATLILSARNLERLQAVAEECQALQPKGIVPTILVLDLGVTDELESKTRLAEATHGRIDVVVHCGGSSSRSLVEETSWRVHKLLMDVNFLSSVAITQTLLPGMLRRGCGHIVVMSSVQGLLSVPFRSSYSASKHALHGFFNALRAEVAGRGIGVTVICPGYVRTSLSDNAIMGDGSRYGKTDKTTASGMIPAAVAAITVDAVLHGKHQVIIAKTYIRLALILQCMAFDLVCRLMRSRSDKQRTSTRESQEHLLERCR